MSASVSAEVVLLLHDAFHDSRIWNRLRAELPVGRFRVHAPDISCVGIRSSAAWAARVYTAGAAALAGDSAAIVVATGASCDAAAQLLADGRARNILLFQPRIDANLRSRLQGTLSDEDIVRFGRMAAEPLGNALASRAPGAGVSNAQARELVSILMESTGWDPTVRQEIQEMLSRHLAEWSRHQPLAGPDHDTTEPWTEVLGRCPPSASVTIVLGPNAGLVNSNLVLAAYRDVLPRAAIIQHTNAEYLWMHDPAAVRLLLEYV